MSEYQPFLDGFEAEPRQPKGRLSAKSTQQSPQQNSESKLSEPVLNSESRSDSASTTDRVLEKPEPIGGYPIASTSALRPSSHSIAARPKREPNEPLWSPDDLTGQTVVLVDSHSLIYQLFHAVAPMSSPTGLPVAAVHGFLRDMADLRDRWNPAYLWCAFDLSEVTFRSELYPSYKEHRESMPDELRMQIPLIYRGLTALGIGTIGVNGFEADDVLATMAQHVEGLGGRCIIVTSDKDCRQLLTEKVSLYNIRKDELFGPDELRTVWGIRPDQVVDFQSLVGDSVDNVPGVPLIGPKLAEQLLNQFGTLENVLDNADRVSGKKRAENLKTYRDQAFLSRKLVQLRRDVPMELDWYDADFSRFNRIEVEELFREFGFRRLAERLLQQEVTVAAPAPIWKSNYQLITTRQQLQSLVNALQKSDVISFDTETTSTNPRDAEPVGYSFGWDHGEAAYVPLRAPVGNVILDRDAVNQAILPIMENPDIKKVGQNIKFDLVVLRGQGIRVQGLLCDTMVADYLLDPGQRNHSLDEIAKRRLNHTTIKISELIGSGKSQICMDQVELPKISEYASEDADIPWRLTPTLLQELEQEGLSQLFQQVELPLVEVLAEMEFNGIRVEPEILQSMSGRFEERIERLRTEIIAIAGEPFNLDSPKQLATILFEKLRLPIIKRTQTGASTDVEVLQELSEHTIAIKLIEYRQLTKLKGTYIDALPKLISAKTGRIHTSFRQDVAATGRLSSTDPNLQNIPIRAQEGREIRSAFRAGPDDWLLLAADYSQIELRVLAHYCGDANLCEAFALDRDIHAQVAAQVYGVELNQVTSDQRRNAKAINFGIIYGQSPYGLAKALRISKDEASMFIDAYFARLPGVRQFIIDTISDCRETGWVSTLLGRRRPVKGVRNFRDLPEEKRRILIEPERIAVNTVIQGTAADLIKLAMINVHRRLQTSQLQAKLLLQIHDELVFEVAPQDADALRELVCHEMIHAVELRVPVKVDTKVGPNWAECD